MSRRPTPLADRFASKVSPSSDENGCLLWLGSSDALGRGRISVPGKSPQLAHRIAWELRHGVIPDGLVVCHRCDVYACVNVEHLFLGTQLDNIADREAKGRTRRGRVERRSGAAHGMSKLTWEQVCEIRARYAGGVVSQRQLACEFGVHHSQIGHIVRGEHWTTPGEPA